MRAADDATISVRRRRPSWSIVAAALVLLGFAGGGLAWFTLSERPAPQHAAILEGDEAAILAARAPVLQVFRFRAMPAVLVLSFPSLGEQGRMLNRLAALIEKAGQPRDRVLTDAELAAAIRASGDSEDTYYYGHDYRARDIARFFRLAERDGVPLRKEEIALRDLLAGLGMLGGAGAVISIPPESAAPPVDAGFRAAILHHELAHGLFFTDATYAGYSAAFWMGELTETERAGFRRFLGGEGYDTGNEELMLNEAQAYLVHTPSAAFFRPDVAGLSEAEAERLRRIFIDGMPPGWLRDAARRQWEGAVPAAASR